MENSVWCKTMYDVGLLVRMASGVSHSFGGVGFPAQINECPSTLDNCVVDRIRLTAVYKSCFFYIVHQACNIQKT